MFAGIGFETTAPTTAAALLEARAAGLTNFSLLSLHKTMPLPLRALLDLGETPISGFLLPGHVSVITGTACYEFLAARLRHRRGGRRVRGARRPRGAAHARAPAGAGDRHPVHARRPAARATWWRSACWSRCSSRATPTGAASASSPAPACALREEFADVRRGAPVRRRPGPVAGAGRAAAAARCCAASPTRPTARLFGARCTPEDPVGACMVSSEGACAARYRYRGIDDA